MLIKKAIKKFTDLPKRDRDKDEKEKVKSFFGIFFGFKTWGLDTEKGDQRFVRNNANLKNK